MNQLVASLFQQQNFSLTYVRMTDPEPGARSLKLGCRRCDPTAHVTAPITVNDARFPPEIEVPLLGRNGVDG
jgi:hypothetical protein